MFGALQHSGSSKGLSNPNASIKDVRQYDFCDSCCIEGGRSHIGTTQKQAAVVRRPTITAVARNQAKRPVCRPQLYTYVDKQSSLQKKKEILICNVGGNVGRCQHLCCYHAFKTVAI